MTNTLKLIESFPRGRTTGALLRLRNIDLLPRKKLEFLNDLETLARDGLIELGKDRKWRAKSRRPVNEPSKSSKSTPDVAVDLSNSLLAAPAQFCQVPAPIEKPAIKSATDAAEEKPDPQALIRYYRSALRSDPRGALTNAALTKFK